MLGAGADLLGVAPRFGAAAAPSTADAQAAGRRARVEDVDALAALAVGDQVLGGLAGRLAGAGDAGRDVDRDDFAAGVQERLVGEMKSPIEGCEVVAPPSEARSRSKNSP